MHNSMDEPVGLLAKWNKLVTGDPILHESTCMTYQK